MTRHMVERMDERWAWVALALVPGVATDPRRWRTLVAAGMPRAVLEGKSAALCGDGGKALSRAFASFDAQGAVERQRRIAEATDARLVTVEDEEYPSLLRHAADRPPFLFVRGALSWEDSLAVAVVGSRRPTAYGLVTAERLAGDLAARGVTVVSGLARGVDTAAHQGALSRGGRTVAVLGSGLDVVYPPENRRLAASIARAGALVSQFPMGAPPLPQHFPARNHVIAGLSIGTVVVEAAERSGALITARCAGELGREVYAVPGNVSSATSQGANRLIQDGARLVRDWRDVVAEWPEAWRRALKPAAAQADAPQDEGAVGGGERQLLRLIGEEPVSIEAITARTGLPPGQVAASLMTLELSGAVRQLPGRGYVRHGAR